MSFYFIKQLPIISPQNYIQMDIDLIRTRVPEPSYAAWDLQPFAQECGYHGPPFRWDEERRFLLRCELDAAYFHLYGIARDDKGHFIHYEDNPTFR